MSLPSLPNLPNLPNLPEEKSQWFVLSSSSSTSDEVNSFHSFNSFDVKLNECLREIQQLRDDVSECRVKLQTMETDNLRLVNRVLEAEIAMERYKNLLLRKNISFPFSPITAKIIQGIQM